MALDPTLVCGLCGALGGLASELIKHDYLEGFKFKNNRIYLGCFRIIIIGAIVGIIAGMPPINAFMWGMAGMFILKELQQKVIRSIKAVTDGTSDENIEDPAVPD